MLLCFLYLESGILDNGVSTTANGGKSTFFWKCYDITNIKEHEGKRHKFAKKVLHC